jgi:hypothetical protein
VTAAGGRGFREEVRSLEFGVREFRVREFRDITTNESNRNE